MARKQQFKCVSAPSKTVDYYGFWKLFDALTDAAFKNKNRRYALGNPPSRSRLVQRGYRSFEMVMWSGVFCTVGWVWDGEIPVHFRFIFGILLCEGDSV